MKLINRITSYYVLNTILIFVAALGILYYAVETAIISEVNEQLRKTNREVKEQLGKGVRINYHPFVEISEVDKIPQDFQKYSDVSVKYLNRNEEELFRQYISYSTVNGKFYKIITRSSLIEKEDLFYTILYLLISILVTLLVVLFYVNRKSAKKIFNPFYENIKRLDAFSLQKNNELILEKSNIAEFEELNKSLKTLSEKAKKEYKLLKEFTEDLSHELQTPVAIIKSKLELILQKEINDHEIEEYMQTLYQNINKLDRLNRTLLLLTKLESVDFFPSKKINFYEVIAKTVEFFTDAAAQKEINIRLDLSPNQIIEMNDVLADTLLSNLLSNAIKHNYEKGEIIIKLDENGLVIQNTGEEPNVDPSNYFNRFVHSGKSKDSTGLGLSVVKKICDLYNMKITYTFENPYHIISIDL